MKIGSLNRSLLNILVSHSFSLLFLYLLSCNRKGRIKHQTFTQFSLGYLLEMIYLAIESHRSPRDPLDLIYSYLGHFPKLNHQEIGWWI